MKYQITCIKRTGLEFLSTEGADYAAKVTYLAYQPGKIYDPRQGVKQVWLVPLYNRWPE